MDCSSLTSLVSNQFLGGLLAKRFDPVLTQFIQHLDP